MSQKAERMFIAGLIVTGILIVGFFGLRAMFAFRDFRRHGPPPLHPLRDQPVETDLELIRDWMTIPYISHTYRVRPKVLFDALGIDPRGNEEKSLLQLNNEFFGNEPGIVVDLVKTAIRDTQPVSPAATATTMVP